MQEAKVKGFTEVPLCENLSDNVSAVIQCVGMGGLRPNTVLLGWPYNWRKSIYENGQHSSGILGECASQRDGSRRRDAASETVHRATAADMCLLVAKGLHMFPDARDQLVGHLDVWWIVHDGGLLILLPFLLRQHKVWRQCVLRIFAVAQFEDNSEHPNFDTRVCHCRASISKGQDHGFQLNFHFSGEAQAGLTKLGVSVEDRRRGTHRRVVG